MAKTGIVTTTLVPDPHAGKTFAVTVMKTPDGEELVPDEPADVVERYVRMLLRWEDLSTRQHVYEAELKKLQATGDALADDWNDLTIEHQSCLQALEGLDVTLAEAMRKTWAFCKQHLAVLIAKEESARGNMMAIPPTVRGFANPSALHPRGEGKETAHEKTQ